MMAETQFGVDFQKFKPLKVTKEPHPSWTFCDILLIMKSRLLAEVAARQHRVMAIDGSTRRLLIAQSYWKKISRKPYSCSIRDASLLFWCRSIILLADF